MAMLLPKGIPTLEAMVTKNWTHPDNIFTVHGRIKWCTVAPTMC